jgi:hypothetical protein
MSVAGGVIGLAHSECSDRASNFPRCLRPRTWAPRERIGHLVEQRTTFPRFRCLVRETRQPKRSQNQRLGFQIEIRETKRLATSTVSFHIVRNPDTGKCWFEVSLAGYLETL